MGNILLGIDEAGRGAVIGPLVIAGVSIDEKDLQRIKDTGARDSKELSQKRRVEIYKEIEGIAKDIMIIKVAACKIDTYRADGVNLNKLESLKFAEIINKLNPDEAYIDCPDTNIAKFKAVMKNLVPEKTRLVVEHKADSTYQLVGAASIAAKVERESDIAELRKKYGDFGPGYPSNEITMKWLRDWLKEHGEYPNIVRQSWATVSDVKKENQQSSLGSWLRRK